MTAHHFFSRSLVAFSAIFTLATAVAMIAAPSTARAESGNQIIMSDGNVDCPPCRWFRIYDQDGLSFRDLTGEVQNGDEIVISAQVTFNGTAGKPRTGSVVFSTSMDDTDDHFCTQLLMTRQAGDQACAAVSSAFRDAATAAASPASSTAVPTSPETGIIMRDGGVCDPIRHMGC